MFQMREMCLRMMKRAMMKKVYLLIMILILHLTSCWKLWADFEIST